MSHNNPQKRAKGGRVFYASGNSKVASEAFERKDGGKVCAMDDKKSPKRMDKRARGGSVKSSAGGGSADKHPIFK